MRNLTAADWQNLDAQHHWESQDSYHQKLADAEQAKQTGGMVALLPRQQDMEMLAVPQGEPPEDLHCTLVFFGEDVMDLESVDVASQCEYIAQVYGPIQANIFGYAMFNPDTENACGVYLVGGNPDLAKMQRELKEFAEDRFAGVAEQHDPFCAHITATYNLPAILSYQGPVFFDHLLLKWAGETHIFPL